MAKFSLSWDAYSNNICSGLSSLQQNGEFVDMTLAADGHHVKVHQLIMSLASPYIKEIITSTQCRHPVIFLSKISYTTLCAILEYIYTGEVTVEQDALQDLVQAARELCIRGLEEMKYKLNSDGTSQTMHARINEGHSLSETNLEDEDHMNETEAETTFDNVQALDVKQSEEHWQANENTADQSQVMEIDNGNCQNTFKKKPVLKPQTGHETQLQYCISYRGSLQMILNRYIYYLKYKSQKGRADFRTWRCSDNFNPRIKCPASVTTQGSVIIQRKHAHNHPFHDRGILRKVRESGVFTAMDENALQELVKNKGKLKPPTIAKNNNTDEE